MQDYALTCFSFYFNILNIFMIIFTHICICNFAHIQYPSNIRLIQVFGILTFDAGGWSPRQYDFQQRDCDRQKF